MISNRQGPGRGSTNGPSLSETFPAGSFLCRFNNGSLQGKDDITFLVMQKEPCKKKADKYIDKFIDIA
ncbi:MAG: hypothetical protein C4554_07405 [Dethiobacter sp.]|nr:MAG: hypothetical protein C4554_07405 [Dethiobacter sp.]